MICSVGPGTEVSKHCVYSGCTDPPLPSVNLFPTHSPPSGWLTFLFLLVQHLYTRSFSILVGRSLDILRTVSVARKRHPSTTLPTVIYGQITGLVCYAVFRHHQPGTMPQLYSPTTRLTYCLTLSGHSPSQSSIAL